MLTDEEFYSAVQPYLRAKSAGKELKITPKGASATWSNGQKDPDGVTESTPPNGPILSIIVRSRASQVPDSQRTPNFRDMGKWRSSERKGQAWPVVIKDELDSPVDGLVSLGGGMANQVSIAEVRTYQNNRGASGWGETVAFRLKSVRTEDVQYIIQFDGRFKKDGDFACSDPELEKTASDWALRWMYRQQYGC